MNDRLDASQAHPREVALILAERDAVSLLLRTRRSVYPFLRRHRDRAVKGQRLAMIKAAIQRDAGERHLYPQEIAA